MPANVHFDFTAQTPPNLPAGCADTLGTVVTASATLGGAPTVAAHGTVLPGPTLIASISSGVQDGVAGKTKSVATFGYTSVADSFQGLAIWWRSTVDDNPTGGTAYWLNVELGSGPQVTWRKYTAGTEADIGTSSPTWTAGRLYRITIDHTGAGLPTFTLQDLTGSLYWTGTAWQAGASNFTLGSDGSVTGQGFNGASFYGSSGAVRIADYQVILPGPTTVTLTGPTSGTTGVESTAFTATLDQAAPTGGTTVSLASDGPGDVFHATSGGSSVTSISIPQGSMSGTFLLVAGTAGARHVSITSAGLTVAGSPITYTASTPPPATGITLSCPAAVIVGTPATLTATANGSLGVNHVLTITDTSGLALGNLTILAGQTTATVSFTETRAGTWAFSAVDGGALPVTGCSYTASVLVVLMTDADLTSDFAGLTGTVGFTVFAGDGSTFQARTTAGVHEPVAGTGSYLATFDGLPGTWYAVVWDTGGSTPQYSSIDRVIREAVDGSGRATIQPSGLDAVPIDEVATAGGTLTLNFRQAMAQALAMLGGQISGVLAAGGTSTVKNGAGTATRISPTTDALGNRSAMVHNPPA